MTLSIKHPLTAITPDNPAYEINPSNWNASHTIAGAASTQLVYGNVSGGLDQDSLLTWDATNHVLSAGAGSVTHPSITVGDITVGLYGISSGTIHSLGAAVNSVAFISLKIDTSTGRDTTIIGPANSLINASSDGIFIGSSMTTDATTTQSIMFGGANTLKNSMNTTMVGYGNSLDSTGISLDNNSFFGYTNNNSAGLTDSIVVGCFNRAAAPGNATDVMNAVIFGSSNRVKTVSGGATIPYIGVFGFLNRYGSSNGTVGRLAPTRLTIIGDALQVTTDVYANKNICLIGTDGGTGTARAEFDSDLSTINLIGKLRPCTDANAQQTACGLFAGTGAPADANGADGDIYFRSDGGALTTIYQRRAGVWTGIV
jgi:hypothetical protein